MQITLKDDFKEFLKLLNSRKIRYLLVGGWAVSIHGYPRYTGDMDIWVAVDPDNARRVSEVVKEFGFNLPEVKPELFGEPKNIVRMGEPPVRIEVHTRLSGVEFEECYKNRQTLDIDGIPVNVIGIEQLKINKRTTGRYKDLDDLEHLEGN